MSKKYRVHGLLIPYNVKDANGHIYAEGSINLPEGCTNIEGPKGDIFNAQLSHSAKGIEAEFCVRGDQDAINTIQKLIDSRIPFPRVDVAYMSGLQIGGFVTDEMKVIRNKFWAFVFKWKPMRYVLWFIFRRVDRIRVITGFKLTEVSLVQR